MVLLALAACTSELPTESLGAVVADQIGGGVAPGTHGLVAFELGSLGGGGTSALDINDAGQVVGSSVNARGVRRAFIWASETGMRDLGTVDDTDGPAAALAINAAGEAVGWSEDARGRWVPTRWRRDGRAEPLPYPAPLDPAPPLSQVALDINDHGEVIGYVQSWFMVRWPAEGGLADLACAHGYPSAINNDGTVVGIASYAVGASVDGFEYSGFILAPRDRSCRGLITDQFLALEVAGINDRGVVIGRGGAWSAPSPYGFDLDTPLRPFEYTDAGGFRLDPSLPENPRDINIHGEVVGGEVSAINDLGDRVGGSLLWTGRAGAYVGARRAHIVARAFDFDLSLAVPRGCPPALADLVRRRALPSCPAPVTGSVRR